MQVGSARVGYIFRTENMWESFSSGDEVLKYGELHYADSKIMRMLYENIFWINEFLQYNRHFTEFLRDFRLSNNIDNSRFISNQAGHDEYYRYSGWTIIRDGDIISKRFKNKLRDRLNLSNYLGRSPHLAMPFAAIARYNCIEMTSITSLLNGFDEVASPNGWYKYNGHIFPGTPDPNGLKLSLSYRASKKDFLNMIEENWSIVEEYLSGLPKLQRFKLNQFELEIFRLRKKGLKHIEVCNLLNERESGANKYGIHSEETIKQTYYRANKIVNSLFH